MLEVNPSQSPYTRSVYGIPNMESTNKHIDHSQIFTLYLLVFP